MRDGGATARSILQQVAATVELLQARNEPAAEAMAKHLARGHDALESVIAFVLANFKTDPNAVFAGSVPYLKLAGIVLGGWQMARALLVALDKHAEDTAFYTAKIATAHFYADHILSQAGGLEASITSANGAQGMLALDSALL